ncbi:hypothetical protein HRR83_007263 [Exophiala dermatitidis]|uniref:Uncharacterized protein n=2 Tax=Exophiala dermatitidis TaxID=5970 RepID=H6C408_EXODN|nr:uncharacterized protein HMPREF1120_06384 [Exophiala dermatitidis NIH/UT8656]KAJ4511221.1 hypothetical protein HRR73_006554 [Exophiala dermatitidis]EHY58373.1 hypothetical protein HMPREF1120_06384 [Exophiala dermatitidis NIH/UT8656]KAJ4511843.1 hypothetical protein HRR74_006577 [Exophiala dermatitidis]KAJ4534699.1 hypothetical protein HRR76_006613 [Exophiala dermatitidis]KAJ4550949.1 hypothetical protein HRR77_003302 [Exophiala dermatitidis]
MEYLKGQRDPLQAALVNAGRVEHMQSIFDDKAEGLESRQEELLTGGLSKFDVKWSYAADQIYESGYTSISDSHRISGGGRQQLWHESWDETSSVNGECRSTCF